MTRDAEKAALIAHLRTRAPAYFAELGEDVRVDLLSARPHRFSSTYLFRLTGRSSQNDVLAKVARASNRGTEALRRDRPRLSPVTDWENVRPRLEYRSLSVAFEHFQRLGDARLGAVRPLDYIPELRAIIMEVNKQPTLRQLLWKGTRFTPFIGTELDAAFRHAGAWLREFHRLPGDETEMGTLRAQRGEVLAALAAYGQFLEERLGTTPVLKDAVSTAILRARTVLPSALPLGLAHSDFAPRNVFVSPNGRVTVIDMIGKWRVPIYEDLAYFITALRMSGPQRFSHGAAFHRDCLDRYEHEVLVGYFGAEGTPYGPIRVFKLLLLLDKWASLPARRGRGTVPARVFRAASETLSRRYFSHEIASLAAELEAAA